MNQDNRPGPQDDAAPPKAARPPEKAEGLEPPTEHGRAPADSLELEVEIEVFPAEGGVAPEHIAPWETPQSAPPGDAQSAPPEDAQAAPPEDAQIAPPGDTVHASPPCFARDPRLTPETPGRYAPPEGEDRPAVLARDELGRTVLVQDRHLGRAVALRELWPEAGSSAAADAGAETGDEAGSEAAAGAEAEAGVEDEVVSEAAGGAGAEARPEATAEAGDGVTAEARPEAAVERGDGGETRDEARIRFLREARILAQLDHPALAAIHELGQRPDGSIYATESHSATTPMGHAVAECKTLYDRLALLPHLLASCQAVACAHQAGVIHRALSPDCIRVGPTGETQVGGWSVMRIAGRRDRSHATIRAWVRAFGDADAGLSLDARALPDPAYLAPETVRGELDALNARTDVYGLGAVLYLLLTGTPPVTGSSTAEVFARIPDAEIEPPHRRHEGIPEALSALCMKALSPNPRDRYADAGEMAAELISFQAGARPVAALPFTSGELLWKLVRQNKLATLLALLLVGGLLAGAPLVYERYQRSEADARRERTARRRAERAGSVERLGRIDREEVLRAERIRTRQTHLALAEALVARARSLLRSHRYGDALVYARAAFLHDPAHPRSPYRFRDARRDSTSRGPRASSPGERLLARARSVLYRLTLERRLSLRRTLPQPEKSASPVKAWRLAFSPNGGYLAVARDHKRVALWSMSEQRYVAGVEMPARPVISVAFSPNGQLMAAAGGGGAVRLWRLPEASVVFTLKAHERLATSVAFSPDGALLATAGTDRRIRIWRIPDGHLLTTFAHPNVSVWALAFSPDGKVLASAGWQNGQPSRLRLWDLKTRRPVATHSDHIGPIWALAFSPDGKVLASAGLDRVIRLYHARKGRLIRQFPAHEGDITSIAFSPDGRLLASGSLDHTLRLWDPLRGKELEVVEAHRAGVWGVGFSPDGRQLATSGWDGNVKIWRLRTKASGNRFTSSVLIDWAAYLNRGRTLLAMSRTGRLLRYRPGRPDPEQTFAPAIVDRRLVALSPRNPLAAVVHPNGTLWIWDVARGVRKWILASQRGHQTTAVAFSPDGAALLAGDHHGRIRRWQLPGRQVRRLLWLRGQPIRCLAVSHAGRRLLVSAGAVHRSSSGANKHSVKPKDAPLLTLWRLRSPHAPSPAARHAARRNGRRKSRRSGRSPGAFQAPATRLRSLSGCPGPVARVSWSRDDRLVAATCGDGFARVWDPRTGRLLQTLGPHGDDLIALAFSPVGDQLATVSRDRALRLWDVVSGRLNLRLPIKRTPSRIAFSPDGRGILLPSPTGLRVVPRALPPWKGDPKALLRNAERRVGRELHGFSLLTRP